MLNSECGMLNENGEAVAKSRLCHSFEAAAQPRRGFPVSVYSVHSVVGCSLTMKRRTTEHTDHTEKQEHEKTR